MICSEEYRPLGARSPSVSCIRQVREDGRHIGDHQGWETVVPSTGSDPWDRLWTWSAGGASGTSRIDKGLLEPCLTCGILEIPKTSDLNSPVRFTGSPDAYVLGEKNPLICFTCALWAERVEEYVKGWHEERPTRYSRGKTYRYVRREGSPWLECWSKSTSGAYGNRKYTVTWFEDGEKVGPASSLWSSGRIPWWLDEKFPPNAYVESAEKPIDFSL